ncbi:MAG: SRPBCC family protein [Chloroflexota bacterium]
MAEQTQLEQRTAEVYVDAAQETVYDVIADIPRMSEWSPDLEWVTFTEGYRETAEGAKFQWRNQIGPIKWTDDCKVRVARRGEELAWDVVDGEWPVTRWRFQMEPQDGGTRLMETVELVRVPKSSKVLWLFQGGVDGHMEKLQEGMNQTLKQIKSEVEQEQHAAVAS